jgi:hypothetical protein
MRPAVENTVQGGGQGPIQLVPEAFCGSHKGGYTAVSAGTDGVQLGFKDGILRTRDNTL